MNDLPLSSHGIDDERRANTDVQAHLHISQNNTEEGHCPQHLRDTNQCRLEIAFTTLHIRAR